MDDTEFLKMYIARLEKEMQDFTNSVNTGMSMYNNRLQQAVRELAEREAAEAKKTENEDKSTK